MESAIESQTKEARNDDSFEYERYQVERTSWQRDQFLILFGIRPRRLLHTRASMMVPSSYSDYNLGQYELEIISNLT